MGDKRLRLLRHRLINGWPLFFMINRLAPAPTAMPFRKSLRVIFEAKIISQSTCMSFDMQAYHNLTLEVDSRSWERA